MTEQDKDLLIAVKDIIREDCKREKCKAKSFTLFMKYYIITLFHFFHRKYVCDSIFISKI